MEDEYQQKQKLRKPVFLKLKELKPGQNGYNVYLKILSIQSSAISKYNGNTMPISDLICGDESGIVEVRLKGKDTEGLDAGTVIAIRNGRIMIVKGHIRLEIDRWGKVTKEDGIRIDHVLESNNISKHEYEMKISTK